MAANMLGSNSKSDSKSSNEKLTIVTNKTGFLPTYNLQHPLKLASLDHEQFFISKVNSRLSVEELVYELPSEAGKFIRTLKASIKPLKNGDAVFKTISNQFCSLEPSTAQKLKGLKNALIRFMEEYLTQVAAQPAVGIGCDQASDRKNVKLSRQ